MGPRSAAGVLAVALSLGGAATAPATQSGAVGPVSRGVPGPYGMRLLAPASHVTCAADHGPSILVSVRWSAPALARPVRAVRVLLQRPGSEAVIASVTFAPARPVTTRRGTLTASACRENFDVRYELFVGAVDVPHDHQSVVFRTHGVAPA